MRGISPPRELLRCGNVGLLEKQYDGMLPRTNAETATVVRGPVGDISLIYVSQIMSAVHIIDFNALAI